MSDFQFTVDEITLYERPVKFRMPFRYGVVTLTSAPEAYVAARITTRDGTSHHGISADLLAPKWFDKSPDLTDTDNHDQLRQSIAIAARQYTANDGFASAFEHHQTHEIDHHAECATQGLPGLVAGFGVALVDRAILDACCRARDVPLAQAVAQNLAGITDGTAPDLAGFDVPAFLSTLRPSNSMLLRHTVGLTDAIDTVDPRDEVINDGLPQSLRENCEAYDLRAFKLKLCGDADADIDRLTQIAAVLDKLPHTYFCTLDGNEQFQSAEAFTAFWHAAKLQPRLTRLISSIRIIEQPIVRQQALELPLGALGRNVSCEIDESDADVSAFPKARAVGYRGISSKSCKGIYRSLLNRARVAKWNSEEPGADYFMSAEDLCTQAGIALQQDLSLASLIGCQHIERNGHQYGDGLSGASRAWRTALHNSHGDLYHTTPERLLLKVVQGSISTKTVTQAGYGTAISVAQIAATLQTVQVFRDGAIG